MANSSTNITPKTEAFTWEFDGMSRTVMREHEKITNSDICSNEDEMTFDTGMLTGIKNICMVRFSTSGCIDFTWEFFTPQNISVKKVQVEFCRQHELLSTAMFDEQQIVNSIITVADDEENEVIVWTSTGLYKDEENQYWNDEIDQIRLVFDLQFEQLMKHISVGTEAGQGPAAVDLDA